MRAQRHVEQLHVDLAHVMPHPLIEDVNQESPQLLRLHRPFRNPVAGLAVEWPRATGPRSPPQVRQRNHIRVHSLHDRDELHEPGPQRVAEEAIHGQRVPGVAGMHGAQDVALHPCFFSISHPRITWSKVPLPPLSTR